MNTPPILSIITATYNAELFLPKLIQSLRDQIDKDFEWIVADGASTDGTLELLKSVNDFQIKILSKKDHGIYDALNRGIEASSAAFYLVVGADDILYPNCIKDYKSALAVDAEIVTAWIDSNEGVLKPKSLPDWWARQFSYVSGHSVGAVFRKSLHDQYGYYSKKFPIAADQYFIQKAVQGGATVKHLDVVVGKFDSTGVSSIDILGTITESYRIQILLGKNKFFQTLFVILRLLKNLSKI